MRQNAHVQAKGIIAPQALIATAFFGLITVISLAILPDGTKPEADMRITSERHVVAVGETFEIKIEVESIVPVNVFAGELRFNGEVISVKSIDYNTSIADIWAELPWYSNGDGTLNFSGGTTLPGGFQGTDSIINVTFEALKEGDGVIYINEPKILRHDGRGTDSQLAESVNSVFKIVDDNNNLIEKINESTNLIVAKELPSTDLNGDGKQSLADISIFMLNFGTYNILYDFNLDGKVNIQDLNILLTSK
jgi:hypothetical protein